MGLSPADVEVMVSKLFCGIESEHPFHGRPFVQVSFSGCGKKGAIGEQYKCLDPVQQHTVPDHDQFGYGPGMTQVSTANAHFIATGLVDKLIGIATLGLVNHVTFDIGCAESGFCSWDKHAWFMRIIREATLQLRRVGIVAPIVVESMIGPDDTDRGVGVYRRGRIFHRVRFDSDDHPPAWHSDTMVEFRRGLVSGDEIKLVVHSKEGFDIYTRAWAGDVAGLTHEDEPGFSLVLSPLLSKGDAESIMGVHERGVWGPRARLILPQHFFLDRWDR